MDMQNLLNKLNGLLAETEMTVKKCAFCGGNIAGTGKTTEKGDTICKDCDDHYAFDGPGGKELDETSNTKESLTWDGPPEADSKRCIGCGAKTHVDYTTGRCVGCLDQSAKDQGRKGYRDVTDALDESPEADAHVCHTCGRPMPNWDPGDGHECDECAEGMSPEDSDPDKIDEAGLTKNALYGQMRKTSRPANYKPEEHESDKSSGMRDLSDTDDLDYIDSDHSGDPGSNPAPWGMKSSGTSCWGCGQDWKENWSSEDLGPGEGYEEYGLDAGDKICPDCAEELTGGELNEAAMCKDCSARPCVCESEQLDEVTPPGFKKKHPGLMGKLKKQYPGEKDKAYATAWKISKTDEDGSAELDQLKRMMECWGPMAAPQPSGMNVTTNVDSKTGNKTVTVTADGEGAEDLMKILTMAGIAVAPASVVPTTVGEQLANEPDPQTLDAHTQLIDMAGGPNAPHGQYNPDRARDNSMTFVDEAVGRLASKLRAKFQNQ